MKYETNIKEMEEIVKKMSSGSIGIEDGLKLYERGVELAKESLQELNEIKGKMEILNKELAALDIESDEDDEDDDDDE